MQIPSALWLALALGAWPGPPPGSRASRILPTRALRSLLGAVIALTAARVWYDVLRSGS